MAPSKKGTKPSKSKAQEQAVSSQRQRIEKRASNFTRNKIQAEDEDNEGTDMEVGSEETEQQEEKMTTPGEKRKKARQPEPRKSKKQAVEEAQEQLQRRQSEYVAPATTAGGILRHQTADRHQTSPPRRLSTVTKASPATRRLSPSDSIPAVPLSSRRRDSQHPEGSSPPHRRSLAPAASGLLDRKVEPAGSGVALSATTGAGKERRSSRATVATQPRRDTEGEISFFHKTSRRLYRSLRPITGIFAFSIGLYACQSVLAQVPYCDTEGGSGLSFCWPCPSLCKHGRQIALQSPTPE